MALFFLVTSAIAAIVGDPYAALFCCIGVAFVLLSSVLNVHSLKRNAVHDYGPVMAYFASFFVLMFLFPMALVLIDGPRVGMYPWTLGVRLGDWRTGLTFIVVTLPLLALSLVLGSKDPELRRAYPFSKEALERPGRFALYELAYVAFYYLAWEFAFPGGRALRAARLPAAHHSRDRGGDHGADFPLHHLPHRASPFRSFRCVHPRSCRGRRDGRHRLHFVRLVLPRAGRCLERLPRVS